MMLLVIGCFAAALCIGDGQVFNSSTNITEYKVGVIMISGHGAPFDVQKTGPAIHLAIEKVNTDILPAGHRLTFVEKHYGPDCDISDAPG